MNEVAFWRGRPLTELSQAELIDAIQVLGKQVAELYTDDAIEQRALGRIEQMRRENTSHLDQLRHGMRVAMLLTGATLTVFAGLSVVVAWLF